MMNITIWCENYKQMREGRVKEAYPIGMGETIAAFLEKAGNKTIVVLQNEGDDGAGLTDEILESTDVLFWWGHCYHGKVNDELVKTIVRRVWKGMGIVFLHSAHLSKPFRALVGGPCTLKWREVAEKERLWFVEPNHQIFEGLDGEYLEIPHEEMYGEPFGIPQPDRLLAIGWFQGGEVFRSIAFFKRYYGKVIYFQPGHETYPVYQDPKIQKLLTNIAEFVKPDKWLTEIDCPNVKPLEPIAEN
ncbi:ThuA domain-containing protein [bacterium]|nr:ThuA domain-containing protein [bacterium]